MVMLHFVVGIVSAGMMILGAGIVSGQPTSTGSGQAYPNKPIRIVTSAVGGASDFDSRLIAQGIPASLGQQVIVDNRSGVLEDIVSRSSPDGYTLLVDGSSMWVTPLIQKMSYDPVKDFSPITLITTSPNIVTVHPSVAVNSIKDLIALAKAKPGELNYGSAGVASSPHLATELFKSMSGVNIVHIPYKGDRAGD